MIPFKTRVRSLLAERGIPDYKFFSDTGLDRVSLFYRKRKHHRRHIYMAIAYYFGTDVDELLEGTEALDDFYNN